MQPRAANSVEAVFREERGRLLAVLAARFGDLDLAQDVAQEAIAAALTRWPVDGVPEVRLAWLLTTARRKAVDRIGRDRTQAQRLAMLAAEVDRADPMPARQSVGELPDERLTLFFTCCHPALPPEAQVALTLRFLAGMTTPEVAAAFLVTVPTTQQRIVRAKRKIAQARIPFRVPDGGQLRSRLAVLTVVYVLFTEGYASTAGDALVRAELSDEAIRLARMLHRLLPQEGEVTGLLALILLTDARRDARTDPDGVPISLEDQDRRRWDAEKIAEGCALVIDALAAPLPGSYAVQAAIAALHDEAPDVATTDWPWVVALYDVLLRLTPSPLVQLNRAVAVAMRDGPAAGLALIDRVAAAHEFHGYHHLPAARADLLPAWIGRSRRPRRTAPPSSWSATSPSASTWPGASTGCAPERCPAPPGDTRAWAARVTATIDGQPSAAALLLCGLAQSCWPSRTGPVVLAESCWPTRRHGSALPRARCLN